MNRVGTLPSGARGVGVDEVLGPRRPTQLWRRFLGSWALMVRTSVGTSTRHEFYGCRLAGLALV